MNNRIAILDLGTNTFHLLIIEVKADKHFEILFKTEKFVKLAEESITHIGDKAFVRGINLLKEYKEAINQYLPEKIFAFGTAALRNADNAPVFVKKILKETGIEVKVISGDEEATLIYEGVKQAVQLNDTPALIMDIGGGSTEFIIANKNQIFWKQSFPLGASVLKQGFHHTEPILMDEKKAMVNFIKKELIPLFAQKENYKIHHLVGASGSFDSYASMIAFKYYSTGETKPFRPVPNPPRGGKGDRAGVEPEVLNGKTSFDMNPEELDSLFSELEKATLEERLQIPGLLAFRAEMIVAAAILTAVVMKHFSFTHISQSGYALKEGVVWQLKSSSWQ